MGAWYCLEISNSNTVFKPIRLERCIVCVLDNREGCHMKLSVRIGYFFIIMLTIITLQCSAKEDSANDGEYDLSEFTTFPYRKARVLFDQDTILASANISEANSDAIDTLCEQAFIKARKKLFIERLAGHTLPRAIIPLLCGTFAWILTKNIFSPNVAGVIAVGTAAICAKEYIQRTLRCFRLSFGEFNSAFLMYCLMYQTDSDPMFIYGTEYAKKKRFLNLLDDAQDRILYEKYKRLPYVESLFVDGNMKALRSFLSIPIKSKKPNPFNIKDVAGAFELYSSEAQEMIMCACINHIQSYQSESGINLRSREFLNLVSSPGTGKSMLARTLGKLMNLPIETVCLAGASIEKIFGSETEPGLILEKLGQLGCKNGILFFDELDRIADDTKLLSILLPLLEPNEKQFYSPYLQRHIDISHLFIVVAGNFSFKDEALCSRFHMLKSVNLEIVNIEKLMKHVMEEYLPSKLLPEEHCLLADTLKEEWSRAVRTYISLQKHVSFRDAQAKVDRLIGNWRINMCARA